MRFEDLVGKTLRSAEVGAKDRIVFTDDSLVVIRSYGSSDGYYSENVYFGVGLDERRASCA